MTKPFKRAKKPKCYTVNGVVTEQDILTMARKLCQRRFAKRRSFECPGEVKDYLSVKFASQENETFHMLFLNNKYRLLSFECLFTGTINGTSVYPREVVKRSLEVNAAAVILVHNHPSGDVEPSEKDITITKRLQKALSLVDIKVLDHFIAGGGKTLSMAEKGYL